jgi:hypothetical protein
MTREISLMINVPTVRKALNLGDGSGHQLGPRLVLILCALCINGCRSGTRLVPVAGTVTLDGRPLSAASVVLSPVRATSPGPFCGKTDAQGRFQLGPTDNAGTGAAAGEYFVIITTVEPPPGGSELSPPPQEKEIVPDEYRSGTKRFQVPAGGTREANFAMTSGAKGQST